MALQSTLVNSAMSIRFKSGIDALGKDVVKAKKYSNIKLSAPSEDLLLIGTMLGDLMKHEVLSIVRTDESDIANQ